MFAGFQVTGGFDGLVFNYFNAIPNTTRAYRSISFSPTKDIKSYEPDIYGTISDRDAIVTAMNPPGQSLGIYAECSIAPTDAINFFRSITNTEVPWTGAIFGLAVNSTWYWCTDQVIVQRCLAAKNMIHAKAGIVLAMTIKLFPLWLMIIPGMAARVLFAGEQFLKFLLLFKIMPTLVNFVLYYLRHSGLWSVTRL